MSILYSVKALYPISASLLLADTIQGINSAQRDFSWNRSPAFLVFLFRDAAHHRQSFTSEETHLHYVFFLAEKHALSRFLCLHRVVSVTLYSYNCERLLGIPEAPLIKTAL